MLTGWTILPKPSFINQRCGWWNSVEDFDPCMFHNYHSSYYQPKIWKVGVNPTTCSMQVYHLQFQQIKFHHQNSKYNNLFNASHQIQWSIPQLQISTCSTTIILLLSTKDFGGRGRPQEKGFHAVNSKQKLTKNLFLVGSFLMCWLAGPFCQNLLYQPKTWMMKLRRRL